MKGYQSTQKIIHWLMALLIMLDLNIAQKFGGDMDTLDRLESRIDHSSMGLIIASLFILRLVFRYKYGPPDYPASMPRWQVVSAKFGHYGLYFLMGGLIITGLLTARYASDPIFAFNAINLTIDYPDIETYNVLRLFHEIFTNLIIVLIGIHIFASMYHHFIAKDLTTINMVKFWKS